MKLRLLLIIFIFWNKIFKLNNKFIKIKFILKLNINKLLEFNE